MFSSRKIIKNGTNLTYFILVISYLKIKYLMDFQGN